MTREETIARIKDHMEHHGIGKYPSIMLGEALDLAITALRGPTREQVERMRGKWIHTHSDDNFWTEVWKCSYCGFEDNNGDCFDFCPNCGAPITDEAVDIMLRRWKEAFENA